MKQIAITGTTGFVGRHLLDRLIQHSDCNLRVLVRNERKAQNVNKEIIKIFSGDLTKREQLYPFIQPGNTVINLAYMASKSLDENLTAVRNLTSVCIQNNIKRMIHCSTAVVAGRAPDSIVTETTECIPFTDYEIAKYEIEKAFVESYGKNFELVIVRPTAIYGPGSKNLMKLANELTAGNHFLRYLRSCLFYRRMMNLVWIENVVQAITHLAFYDKNLDGEVFIISDDDQPANNYRDVEKCLGKRLNARGFYIPIIPLPAYLLSIALTILKRSSVNPSRIYSSEKLKRYGFKGNVQIEEGIALFANWYNEEILHKNAADR